MHTPQAYESHFETTVEINAPPAQVFELLDDHRRLSAHMTKPSWMMAGSYMTVEIDEQQARAWLKDYAQRRDAGPVAQS